VIEGGIARLAVECDGDKHHGIGQYDADMQRQRVLERCGWKFFRVRASAFYSNREEALKELWQLLDERGIKPNWQSNNTSDGDDNHEIAAADELETAMFNDDIITPSVDVVHKRADEINNSEISNAIIHILKNRPNNSCKIGSISTEVLRKFGVITRGNPRIEFEKRVLQCVNVLITKDQIEKYNTQKNRRIRLSENIDEQRSFLQMTV
jgi:hypothetical protein